MAETTGNVTVTKINAIPYANFGLALVKDSTTNLEEVFLLWFNPVDETAPTGLQWTKRAMQISLFREALTSGKQVTVSHGDTSPFVTSVQIGV